MLLRNENLITSAFDPRMNSWAGTKNVFETRLFCQALNEFNEQCVDYLFAVPYQDKPL